jgi:Uma2 family endonuclease
MTMIAHPHISYLSPDDYLQWEDDSDIKHEYINGKVYAMAGASDAHVTIAGNLFALLLNHLRGSGCRVYISDMKVRLETLNRFYYPDVMVTCDIRDQETPNYKWFPCLIVEVLSDSTEAFDRGDKFANYLTLESLQEYILISTKQARIDCFRRQSEGQWTVEFYTIDKVFFELKSINFTGEILALYEQVIFNTNNP